MKEQNEFEHDLSNDEFNPAPLVGDAAPNAAPNPVPNELDGIDKDNAEEKISKYFSRLVKEEKYDELAAAMIKASDEFINNPNHLSIAMNNAFLNQFRSIVTPHNNNNTIVEKKAMIAKNIYTAVCNETNKNLSKAIPVYKRWEEKLKNGQIRDTELYVDKPKNVRLLARGLTVNQGKEGHMVANSFNLQNQMKFIMQSAGMVIDDKSGPELADEWVNESINDYCEKNNLSKEEFRGFSELFGDVNMSETEIGFFVRKSDKELESDHFEEIPGELKEVKDLRTKEDVDEYVNKGKADIEKHKAYDEHVLDIVEQAKEILQRLEKTEEGHGKSDSYKRMHDALENFTKLGEAYMHPDLHRPVKDITMNIVQNAFDVLCREAAAYEKDHSGITNIHRSNFGYGAERLAISRELKAFANDKRNSLEPYGFVKSSLNSAVKEATKKVEFVNRYMTLNNRETINPDIYKNMIEEPNIQRQDDLADVVPVDPKSLPVGYDSYMTLHTFEGGLQAKNSKALAEALAKNMAAYSLKKENADFSVKSIHKVADEIKDLFCLDQMKLGDMYQALEDPKTAREFGDKVRSDLFDIKEDKYMEYIRAMKKLDGFMMSDRNQSKEYKNLRKCVTDAANLGENLNNMTADEKKEAFRNANMKLVHAIKKFTKGNEKISRDPVTNARFDNSLDALAIVSKYTKQDGMVASQPAANIVSSINRVRGKNNKINLSELDKKYGGNHAEKAAENLVRPNQPQHAPRV